MTTMRWSS